MAAAEVAGAGAVGRSVKQCFNLDFVLRISYTKPCARLQNGAMFNAASIAATACVHAVPAGGIPLAVIAESAGLHICGCFGRDGEKKIARNLDAIL